MAIPQTIPKPTVGREALVTLTLSPIAVLAFAAVLGLTTRVRAWQASRAERMYDQGEHALEAHRAVNAIQDFRAALVFDRDNFLHQLRLAQALAVDDGFEEAESYLINLWKRQSQNGIVNVQLQRLAPQRQPTNPALPYDPFARTLSPAARTPRVQNPFQAASLRLNTCIEAQGEFRSFPRAENSFLKPDTEETRLKPKLRGRAADDPGFQGNVMAFVFDSEEKTKDCGSPTALDVVLLLIGRNREGAEQ